MMTFKHLARFEHQGQIHYGELVESNGNDFTVQKLSGDLTAGFNATGQTVSVRRLLCPFEPPPIIICVGLNYRQHANEANLSISRDPVIFTKPADAATGPTDDVHVHKDAQGMLDYEGELVVVIGQDGKDITEANALDYVLGYAAGNDVSARNFQVPADICGGQYCYAKSFDRFAPMGPALASPTVIPDPQKLKYTTKVNGEIRQETSTDDMIWSVRQIIAHLSRGTTLRRGTAIMMGTPSGVGLFRKEFLKDGDIVEVEVEGIGKIANRMVFD